MADVSDLASQITKFKDNLFGKLQKEIDDLQAKLDAKQAELLAAEKLVAKEFGIASKSERVGNGKPRAERGASRAAVMAADEKAILKLIGKELTKANVIAKGLGLDHEDANIMRELKARLKTLADEKKIKYKKDATSKVNSGYIAV